METIESCACLHDKSLHADGIGKCSGYTVGKLDVKCPCQWYYKLVTVVQPVFGRHIIHTIHGLLIENEKS